MALVLPPYFLYNISMKKWGYCLFSVVLSALVLGASANSAFALPKRLPKLTGKRPRITVPKTPATRQLPPTPVVRPNVAAQVERAVTQPAVQAPQAAKAVTSAQVAPTTPAVQDTGTNLTGTQVLAHYYPTWRQELGGMFSKEQLDAVEKAFADTDEWMFVRGEDGELKARNKGKWDYEARFLTILNNSGIPFTDKQIKQLVGGKGIKGFTFKIYFSRIKATGFSHAKGTKPRSDIYINGHKLSRAEMTPEEMQEVMLGKGLAKHRNHLLIQAYLQENRRIAERKTPEEYVALARQYPTKPRSYISRDGRILSREEMTPEEVQEVMVGQGLTSFRNHPLVKAYMKENRLHAEAKTPEEYVALARQYPTKPRAVIYGDDGHRLSRAEMTPEEIQEVNIGRGLDTYRNHPLVQAYLEENRLHAEAKTPEEYVALAHQYPSKPRSYISRDGRILSREEMTPQESQEVMVGRGLVNHRNHPLVKAYMKENRLQAEAQTTEQLYTALITHIKNYGHYPMDKESSLYQNIYNRLRYYQSAMVDGKYADPWLQKIYELKTLIQNAPDGKFTLTPDGQGGYTVEIEEPVTEEDVSAPQKVEEVAPAVPSVHALHEHITEDTKNMILKVRDQAALQRHQFYPWLKDMTQHHLDQIVNKDTSDALWALNRAISFDYKAGQNRRAVTHLLQTINNYVGILGVDEELGYFNKIIYRGKLEPGMLPQADLFHVVAEQEGMSFDDTLAPQVEQLNKLAWQAYKQGQPLSVNFSDDDNQDMLTALEIEKGVPIQTVKQDFQTAIQTLLPPGFEVRMGLHELGLSGNKMTKFRKGDLHIHLERPATTEEMQDGFLTDVSISFDIKGLGRFVRKYNQNTGRFEPRSDKEIAQNYRTLFGAFLDQAAKDKLTDLAR